MVSLADITYDALLANSESNKDRCRTITVSRERSYFNNIPTSMALRRICNYKTIAQGRSGLTRYTGRLYATAARLVVPHERSEEYARVFRLYTKSHIATLFKHYAPKLDPISYLAAAQVFPMRANNYVVEDLIDWLVSESLYTVQML